MGKRYLSSNRSDASHIWKDILHVLIPYIVYIAVMELAVILVTDIISVDAENVMSSGSVITSVAGQLLMMPVVILFMHRDGTLADAYELHKTERVKQLLIIGASAVAGALISVIVTLAEAYTGILADADFVTAQQAYQQDIRLTVISSVLLAPFMEEMLFRGIIYTRISKNFGITAAMAASAFLFAAGHASMLQLLYGFVMGLLLAYSYRRGRTLWAPIMLHMSANAVTIIVWLVYTAA